MSQSRSEEQQCESRPGEGGCEGLGESVEIERRNICRSASKNGGETYFLPKTDVWPFTQSRYKPH